MPPTFLERYQAGEHADVWNDLISLGEAVRHEFYADDAMAVARETMRRARNNIEIIIQRLDGMGYCFQDHAAAAEERLSQLDAMSQIAAQIDVGFAAGAGAQSVHIQQLLQAKQGMAAQLPAMKEAAEKAARKAGARKKSPLKDAYVFSPPAKGTEKLVSKLQKKAGGLLPMSLSAWYEQVGHVSLLGSHPILNPIRPAHLEAVRQTKQLMAGIRNTPPEPQPLADPLYVGSLKELLDWIEDDDGEGGKLHLAISPDELHKADISGDAYYITLPDARADLPFDSWPGFVPYLREVFLWGGFPGWARAENPPKQEIARLTEGLLPI